MTFDEGRMQQHTQAAHRSTPRVFMCNICRKFETKWNAEYLEHMKQEHFKVVFLKKIRSFTFFPLLRPNHTSATTAIINQSVYSRYWRIEWDTVSSQATCKVILYLFR